MVVTLSCTNCDTRPLVGKSILEKRLATSKRWDLQENGAFFGRFEMELRGSKGQETNRCFRSSEKDPTNSDGGRMAAFGKHLTFRTPRGLTSGVQLGIHLPPRMRMNA